MYKMARENRSNQSSAWLAMVAVTERAFAAFIQENAFPCLGAKASLAQRRLQCLSAKNIDDAQDDRDITDYLQAFAGRTVEDSLFTSVAILFPDSPRISEKAFEAALWHRLNAIHRMDRVAYGWDSSVSDDPASPYFSMSIGGKAFYVVGLHPLASRRARRFRCPVLIFNLHSQFERLRTDGRYEELREVIIARDVVFSGSSNPMLAVHGKDSEARQYSGRQVGPDWVCPFRAE